jgi:hypothetical protein
MITERDWLMRLAKQLALFIARALKLADESKREEALATLREGFASATGMELDVLAMLDAASAVELLADPTRAQALVGAVEAMAEVEARCGERWRAEVHRHHARELIAACALRWPEQTRDADPKRRPVE